MNTSDLVAQLSDASDTVRVCAAYNLGALGNDAAVPALLALLKSRKSLDRRAAALALGKIGSAQAVHALQAALKDRDAVVQWFAFESLEARGRRAA